ncbi:MAG: GntR family transcriptional regulator [Chloroflexota bacterium]|nr:GntR family transcriptional regulator [Chloroflexota bacterium]
MEPAADERLVPLPPIYQQIARVLRSRIFHGMYPRGSSIPSENELATEFGVARLTARQALQELRREGVLVSRRGSGTFVPSELRLVRPVRFTGYLEDFILQSLTLVTKLGPVRTVVAPPEVRRAYRLRVGAKVVRIERTRFDGATPVQLSVNYLLQHVAERVALSRLGNGSLSEMMSRELGIETTSAQQSITAEAAGPDSARALRVRLGHPLLLVETIGFSGAKVVNFTHVHYLPEHVFFTATLTAVGGELRPGHAAASANGSRRRAARASPSDRAAV